MSMGEMLEVARYLAGDVPLESEYVRGMAELICELQGLDTGRFKEAVAVHIIHGNA